MALHCEHLSAAVPRTDSRRTNPHVRGSCQVTLPRTVSGPGLTRLLPALSASPALSIVRCSGLLPPALHGSTTRTRGDGVSDPCVLSACCVFQGRLLQQVYLLLHLGTSRKPGAASRESGPCKGKPSLGVTVTVFDRDLWRHLRSIFCLSLSQSVPSSGLEC